MPWAGVKFDARGQNERGQGLIAQLIGGQYQTVWPERYKQKKELPQLPFAWKR